MGSKQSTDQSENKEADQTTNYGLLNLSASHSFHWSHVLIAVMCAIAVLALGKHLFKMHKKRMQRRLSATQPSAPPMLPMVAPDRMQELPVVRISNIGAGEKRKVFYLKGNNNPGLGQAPANEISSDWEP